MRNLLFALLCCVLLLQQTSAQESPDCVPATGEPLRLGAVFSQPSLIAGGRSAGADGAAAMAGVLNQCGGVAGRPVEWQAISASNYDQALEAVATLAAEQIPVVIGSGLDNVSDGLNDGAAEHQLVFWDVTERPRVHPSDWTFALRPADETLGQRTAAYLQNELATILDADLRVALVVEDTPRAIAIADAVRAELSRYVVADKMLAQWYEVAVAVREAEANILLLVSTSREAGQLWLAMRQADANVKAWAVIGQDTFRIGRNYEYLNTRYAILIGSQHFATDSIAEVLEPQVYQAFIREYSEVSGSSAQADTEALSSAIGVYYLMRYILPQVEGDYAPETIRSAIESTTMAEQLIGADTLPLVVRQRQESAFCLLIPAQFQTCSSDVIPFPTWRERLLAE